MSRLSSWWLGPNAKLRHADQHEISDDELRARMNAMRRSVRQRLSDRIEEVFDEACLSGDLETAALLFAAFERQQTRTAGDRRTSANAIEQLGEKLARRRQGAAQQPV